MKPVAPEELSALLDGELEPERSREVKSQIVADPLLRAEFEAISGADVRWRAAAAEAAFAPRVDLPTEINGLSWVASAAVLAGVLICLRMAPKFVESHAFGFGLHGVAFTALLAALLWFAKADRSELAPPRTT